MLKYKIKRGTPRESTKFNTKHSLFTKGWNAALNSIEPINFELGTNTQQHNIYLIMKMKLTLTDDEGHRRRSKVTKNELMVIYRKLLPQAPKATSTVAHECIVDPR